MFGHESGHEAFWSPCTASTTENKQKGCGKQAPRSTPHGYQHVGHELPFRVFQLKYCATPDSFLTSDRIILTYTATFSKGATQLPLVKVQHSWLVEFPLTTAHICVSKRRSAISLAPASRTACTVSLSLGTCWSRTEVLRAGGCNNSYVDPTGPAVLGQTVRVERLVFLSTHILGPREI